MPLSGHPDFLLRLRNFWYTMSFSCRNIGLDAKLKVDDQGHDDEV
jgi:hypothetical protein